MNNQYKNFSTNLARHAGEMIRTNFGSLLNSETKDDNSVVTEIDKAINALVIKEILEQFPHHEILGEEGGNFTGNKEFVWVCDPLDGTLAFTHGLPLSTFSLALIQNGLPILGLIYDPYLDRMYYAEKGTGATVNNQVITVSKSTDINGEFVYVGGYNALKICGPILETKTEIACIKAIVYGGALVAKGDFVATIFTNKTPWDGAAIKVIVEEAGGRVTDLQGKEQNYTGEINGFIASNGLVHDQLVTLLKY